MLDFNHRLVNVPITCILMSLLFLPTISRVRFVDLKNEYGFVVSTTFFSGFKIYSWNLSSWLGTSLDNSYVRLSLFFCWMTWTLSQEFSDPRDANDARLDLDGRKYDGSDIIVQFARGVNHSFLQLFFATRIPELCTLSWFVFWGYIGAFIKHYPGQWFY